MLGTVLNTLPYNNFLKFSLFVTGAILFSILQTRKLRHKEVKKCVQIHTPGDGRAGNRSQVVGYTPQACKACACPTSKLEKELGVSNRDINGFTDEGSYMSEARSWSDTPPCAVCIWGGVGDRSTSGWLLGYQGN